MRTSEIGVTVLDTRDLVGQPIKYWDKYFHSFHFRTKELKEARCAAWAREKCNPHMFQWGKSQ